MNRLCYALSRQAGGLSDLGVVTGQDYLYFFEKACPAWAEPCDIIFDVAEMKLAWESEVELFAILEGPLPDDDAQVKQALVSRVFATGDDALIPQAVVRVVSGSKQDAPPPVSDREPELPLSAALREPEKFTAAFLAIRLALAVREGDSILIDALEALAFLEDRYHHFREALRAAGHEPAFARDLDIYDSCLEAVRDWLLTSPDSFPPQFIRLQFLYLQTGPRTFQQTADRVQAALRAQ